MENTQTVDVSEFTGFLEPARVSVVPEVEPDGSLCAVTFSADGHNSKFRITTENPDELLLIQEITEVEETFVSLHDIPVSEYPTRLRPRTTLFNADGHAVGEIHRVVYGSNPKVEVKMNGWGTDEETPIIYTSFSIEGCELTISR